MIVRKAIAYCDVAVTFPGGDAKDCFSYRALDPDDTQPFTTLGEAGWKSTVTEEGVKLICPKHGDKDTA